MPPDHGRKNRRDASTSALLGAAVLAGIGSVALGACARGILRDQLAVEAGSDTLSAAPAAPLPATRPPLAPLTASAFTPLRAGRTRGGSLAYDIEGVPRAVADMLLDFEGANGVRPWARSFRTLSRAGATTRAEWHFAGKMGINPKVVLAFVREDEPGGGVCIRYELVKRAFGIATFSGDWTIHPVPGVPNRSRLTARVYIDSGIRFANASWKDIEDGLRADAEEMRPWMERRLGLDESAN